MKLYHVAQSWDGQDLESLYQQYGDDAYNMYLEHWPEAGGLQEYHVHYVHLHKTLDEAREYQQEFGGEILVVVLPDDEVDGWVETDDLEYPHPVVRDRIEKEYVHRAEE